MEQITRNNRDRRGGHSGSNLSKVPNGAIDYTVSERKLVKRLSKKKIRRQHRMTHDAINRELANDFTWQDYERELEIDDMWYDDGPLFLTDSWDPEPESEDPYLDDWNYVPCSLPDWIVVEDHSL